MDYKKHNKVAEFLLKNVFEHLNPLVPSNGNSMVDYLNSVERSRFGIQQYTVFSSPYFLDLSWLKDEKVKGRCMFFAHPPDIERNGVIRIIHQITPTLHTDTGLYMWHKPDAEANVCAHLWPYFFFKKPEDIKEFLAIFKKYIKNEEDKSVAGFGTYRPEPPLHTVESNEGNNGE